MIKGILCGKGGHGIITLNQIIGVLASDLGHDVISAETHGMAMRGGSVATFIKIGGYVSPSIARGDADFVLSMDLDEALRNFDYLKHGGCCIVNTRLPFEFPAGFRVMQLDAAAAARRDFKNRHAAGQILLGCLFGIFADVFPPGKIFPALEKNRRILRDAVKYGIARSAHAPS